MKHTFYMTVLVSWCLLACAHLASAQVTIQWDKAIGADYFDLPSDAVSTPDGGYLIAGTSSSGANHDKTEASKGEEDFWIVRTDSIGNILWDKTLGGKSPDFLVSIIPAVGGGYLLAGFSWSNASGDKSEDGYGYWIIKIDANGNKLWDKTFASNNINDTETLGSAIATPDGGYLLAGYSSDDASGDKSEDSRGESDYWIVKVDSIGNKLWDKTLGGKMTEGASNIIIAPDGGYLIVGNSNSAASGDKSENKKGGERTPDYWLVKLLEQPQQPEISSFTLVNAETDQDIKVLKDKDIILLSSPGEVPLNIRANTFPAQVDHIQLEISGPILPHTQTESKLPYALYGDDMNGDYYGKRFKTGKYTLTATPYSKDQKGTPLTLTFQIVEEMLVQSFTLVNTETNQDIKELKDGEVISLSETGNIAFSVRANTSPEEVNHVQFALTGPIVHAQTERQLLCLVWR